MAGFTDYDFAIKFRDVIRRIVKELLDVERPADKIGRIADIDRASGIAYVVYSGDEANATRVKVYPGIQPPKSDRLHGVGNGSIVRVSGTPGARYVAQVLSGSPHQIAPILSNPILGAASSDQPTRQMLSYTVDRAPANDGIWVDFADFFFPSGSGIIDVTTELIYEDGNTGYIQRNQIRFDTWSPSSLGTNNPAPVLYSSSTGMDLTLGFSADVETGRPGRWIYMYFYRSTTSTRPNPLRMNVHLDIVGTGATLEGLYDGVA